MSVSHEKGKNLYVNPQNVIKMSNFSNCCKNVKLIYLYLFLLEVCVVGLFEIYKIIHVYNAIEGVEGFHNLR